MTETINSSKRMELICEYIKTGKQPDGFKISESKNGKYRLTRVKTNKEVLEAKRKRLERNLKALDEELNKLVKVRQQQVALNEQIEDPKLYEQTNEQHIQRMLSDEI